MIPGLPIIDEAIGDHVVRPFALRVLLVLTSELHVVEFRPIKELALRRTLRCSRTTLWRALTSLVTRGYLDREPGAPGRCSSYRLCYTRRQRPG